METPMEHAVEQAAHTDAGPMRVIPFECAPNFRDLGGYATGDERHVAWGRVFRSSHLGWLSVADRERFAALKIGEVFDLRRTSESEAYANQLPPGVRSHRFDIDVGSTKSYRRRLEAGTASRRGTHDMMVQAYRSYVTDFSDRFARLLQLLANAEQHSVVIHCMVGKDRTGIASALLLSALGVSREQILDDYLLSARCYPPEEILARIRESISESLRGSWQDETVMPFCSVHEDYLGAAFDEIDRRHGDSAAYLRDGLGLDEADLGLLRERFLE
jgi:protein-tyrosine phosphatase